MADCRSLIEFLRAFEQHRRRASPSDPSSPRPRRASLSSSSSRPRGRGRLFPALCDHSPLAVVDALALLASLAALAFLAAPYARLLAAEARDAVAAAATRHPAAPCVPLAAGVAAGAAVLAWDAAAHRARRCGRPRCRGLRKAVEYDIQLETEECVRGLPHAGGGVAAAAPARPASEIGDDHRELEAVLRKMAPPNGRTVLIFRAPCGCPKERMEVWGAKKVRRIKKSSFFPGHECPKSSSLLSLGYSTACLVQFGSSRYGFSASPLLPDAELLVLPPPFFGGPIYSGLQDPNSVFQVSLVPALKLPVGTSLGLLFVVVDAFAPQAVHLAASEPRFASEVLHQFE